VLVFAFSAESLSVLLRFFLCPFTRVISVHVSVHRVRVDIDIIDGNTLRTTSSPQLGLHHPRDNGFDGFPITAVLFHVPRRCHATRHNLGIVNMIYVLTCVHNIPKMMRGYTSVKS
jgi:hypothetical protein